MNAQKPAALGHVRVIEFADGRGPLVGVELAGRVLADLGAEVIAVEPPGGSATRRRTPLLETAPDRSLWWETLAVGKKSVVADLSGDVDALRALIDTADVVIDALPPGRLDAAGLGAGTLMARNPQLIVTAISAYGTDGPKARTPASDLTLQAAGGLAGMQGDGDRPPIPVGLPQAGFHAAVQAAADTLIALYARPAIGGQRLDVSAQAAVVWTLMNATGYPSVTGANPPGFCEQRRVGRPPVIPGMRPARLLDCADGYAVIGLHLPGIGERTMAGAVAWLDDTHPDLITDKMRDVDWTTWMSQAREGQLPIDLFNDAYDAIATAFTRTKKTELLELGVERKLLIAPVLNAADVRSDAQLAARDFWVDVGDLTLPGPFARLSVTPAMLRSPAPAAGADQMLMDPRPAPRPRHPQRGRTSATARAFDGLKVADFAWVGVGPIMSKALADHGARVAHIESSTRLDVLRLLPPFRDADPGLNRSHFFANFNTNKRSIDLDFRDPDDLATARALADWADVVVESFVPGTMARYGLDYERLSATRPDLVMLSTCMRGQTGPQNAYGGFGNQGAALAGLFSVTGWPDRPPTGPWGAYTDFIAPRFGVAALAAALVHRQRTGEGQHIDLSQIEAGIQFMGPLIADYTANGRIAEPAGHRSPWACPNGVYPCQGDERYVAVAVEDQDQWRALCRVAGFDADRRALDAAGRLAHAAHIDTAIAAWSASRDPFDAAAELAAAGVPAHAVAWPSDLYADPQLEHRNFFQTLAHPEMGVTRFDGFATRFSAAPPRLERAAPCLGADRDEILSWLAKNVAEPRQA